MKISTGRRATLALPAAIAMPAIPHAQSVVEITVHCAQQRVVSEPETAARLNAAGGEPIREDAATFAAYVATDCARMEQTIAAAGIQPE